MSEIWKKDLRLVGFLHDPIDKTICIEGHANRAKEIAGQIGVSDKVLKAIEHHHEASMPTGVSSDVRRIHEILRSADTQASIANRIVILNSPVWGRKRKHIQERSLHLIHPFSGYAYNFSQDVLRFIESIRKEGLGPSTHPTIKTDNRILLDLLLYYYDKYNISIPIQKWLLHLPEDTRSPISSIFSHLEITGVLAKLFDEGEFWLVYYDIGGVQEFISSARKTMDLWASSYIMSLLSFYVLKRIANTIGYEHIMLPWYPALPLGLLDLGYDVNPKDIILSVTPNSALILLPKTLPSEGSEVLDEIGSIYKFIFDTMRKCWEIIRSKAREYLEKELRKNGSNQQLDVLDVFDEESKFEKVFKNIRLVAIKIRFDGKNLNLERDLDRIVEKIFDCTLDSESRSELKCEFKNLKSLLENYSDYLAYVSRGWKQDFFFPALIRLAQLIMRIGSIRKVRGNYEFSMSEESRNKLMNSRRVMKKCTMCGVRDALFYRDDLKQHLDYNERLCAVDIIKRVFRKKEVFVEVLKEIFKDKVEKVEDKLKAGREMIERIPSTDDIAQYWYKYVLSQVERMDDDIKLMINKIRKIIFDIRNILEVIIESLDDELWSWERSKISLSLEERRIKYAIQQMIETFKEWVHVYLNHIKSADDIEIDSIPAILLDKKKLDEFRGLFREEYLGEIYGEGTLKSLSEIKNKLEALSNWLENLGEIMKRILSDSNQRSKLIDNIIRDMISRMFESLDNIEENAYYHLIRRYKDFIPLPYEPQDTFVILAMDGDNMSKWISGERNIPLILTLGRRNYLQELNKIISGQTQLVSILAGTKTLMTPSLLTTLSMIISLNSREVQRIIHAFRGLLIYTGGDDILALLPPEVAHIVVVLLRAIFSREFIETEYLGKIFKVYGLGWRATASTSLFYVDTKYDLRDAIMRAHSLLDELAKKYNPIEKGLLAKDHDKDGLSMALAARSQIIVKTEYPLPHMLIVTCDRERSGTRRIMSIKEYDKKIMEKIETSANKSDLESIVRFYESKIQGDAEGLLSERTYEGDKIFVGIEPSFVEDSSVNRLERFVGEDGVSVYSSIIAIHTLEALIKDEILSKRFIHDALEHFEAFLKEGNKQTKDSDELFWKLFGRLIKRRLSEKARNYENLLEIICKFIESYTSHVDPVSLLRALKIIDRVLNKSFLP